MIWKWQPFGSGLKGLTELDQKWKSLDISRSDCEVDVFLYE